MIKITNKSHDKEFIRKVEEISGENFLVCMQCGTCSGACPMRDEIDVPTHKVMQLTRFGLRERVEKAKTAWVCASCHTCAALCPRGIDVTKVMDAIRQVTLRENEDHVVIEAIPEDVKKQAPQVAFVSCFRKHTP